MPRIPQVLTAELDTRPVRTDVLLWGAAMAFLVLLLLGVALAF